MASTVDVADGWIQVETPGPVRTLTAYTGLYAGGGTAEDPVLVHVREGHPTEEIAHPLSGPGPVESVIGYQENFTMYGGPVGTPAAGLWFRSWPESNFSEIGPESGSWFLPMDDREGSIRAVGASEAEGHWELHAWTDWGEWRQIDRGPGPVIGDPPTANNVRAASTEVVVLLAINGGSESDPAPEVWWLEDLSEGSETSPWEREFLTPTPDEVTDVVCWEVGCWIAGSRDLAPVVYDYDESDGDEMDVPKTSLDPTNPIVLIANRPFGARPVVLAAQSTNGPMVWTETADGWASTPAPAGALMAARQIDDGIYLIIDEGLWFRPSESGMS